MSPCRSRVGLTGELKLAILFSCQQRPGDVPAIPLGGEEDEFALDHVFQPIA